MLCAVPVHKNSPFRGWETVFDVRRPCFWRFSWTGTLNNRDFWSRKSYANRRKYKEKTTCRMICKSLIFSEVAGRRMFQSPGGGLLLILFVRSHGTQESRVSISVKFVVDGHQSTGRFAPCLSIAISASLKASFRRQKRQSPGPFGAGLMSINEKTQRFAVLSCSGTQD